MRTAELTVTAKLTVIGISLAAAVLCAPPARAQEPAAAAAGGVTVDSTRAKLGKKLFGSRGCAACHGIGKKGKMAGPDLLGVTERRDVAWLRRWLKAPDQMLTTDSIAQALYNQYNKAKMPNLKLTDEEVDALINYLAQETQSHAGR